MEANPLEFVRHLIHPPVFCDRANLRRRARFLKDLLYSIICKGTPDDPFSEAPIHRGMVEDKQGDLLSRVDPRGAPEALSASEIKRMSQEMIQLLLPRFTGIDFDHHRIKFVGLLLLGT